MRIHQVSWFFYIISALYLFSCGWANYSSNAPDSSTVINSNDSRSGDDESIGTFQSSSGRLESGNSCLDNDDCVRLCDSMLSRFADQKECYDYAEKEVQAFRDIYNLLAIGNPRKLSRVDPNEMEPFLEFGPELWQNAIEGFERGTKEDCIPNPDPEDPRDREDCKFEVYYKQEGYWSSGAAATLEWVARNNWLAELIKKYDANHVIMQSLLKVLAQGGEPTLGREGESEEQRLETCNLAVYEEDINGDNYLSCNEDSDGNGELGLGEDQDGDDVLDLFNEDINLNGVLDQSVDRSGESYPNHGRLFPSAGGVSVKLEDHYEAFGADCIGSDRQNYFLLAMQERNKNSIDLGHEVLRTLCNSQEICIRYFYCHIQGGQEAGPGNFALEDTIIHYMGNTSGISGWRSDYNNCRFYIPSCSPVDVTSLITSSGGGRLFSFGFDPQCSTDFLYIKGGYKYSDYKSTKKSFLP